MVHFQKLKHGYHVNEIQCENKAIVGLHSPALCTPVTPFSPIGDVAYRQHAGGGPSHGYRQHAHDHQIADEYSSLLTTDYFNAEIRNLQQMIKRRKESDRGDWPENLLQLQCYIHRLHDAFAETS